MQKENKNTERKKIRATFSRIDKIHPHKMLLYLTIFGSSLIFLFMVIGYTGSHPDADDFIRFKFPKAFVVSLVLLLFSSFSISKAIPAFLQDDMESLKWHLGITLFLGIAFTISQYIGWYELKQSGIYLSGIAAGSYLYVISGLHILHLAIGLTLLTFMYIKVSRLVRDPVKALIMVTNPYEKIRLEILTAYWQFVGVIWVFLFFYFLFSF